MANWPTDDLTTAYLDDPATDRPDQARTEILAAIQKLQTLIAAAGTAANQALLLDASAGIAITGSIATTKAAASGYTRIAPNLCVRSPEFSQISLTRDTLTEITGPTGSKGLILRLRIQPRSNNSIADRTILITAYTDSVPTNRVLYADFQTREFAATAAGTAISGMTQDFHLPCSAAYKIWIKYEDYSGNQGYVDYQIVGYYD